jgi:type II secretory pathway component PulL
MKNSFFSLPESMSPQARNAWRVIAVFLGAVLVVTSYLIFQALQTQAWQ